MAWVYKLRSDKTVVRVDTVTRAVTAFRAHGGGSSAVEAVTIPAEDAPATFDVSAPGGLTIEYGSVATLVLSMLNGVAPEDTHASKGVLLGLVGGGALAMASIVSGPVGWLALPIVGGVVGHYIKTKAANVQMSPVVQVKYGKGVQR